LITLACSLGSGIAGALIVVIYNARSERRRGRVDYLRSEIHELYGPLKFLVASNQNIYRHVSKLETAGLQEYGGENWNKYARDHTEKGIDATISVENLYFELTRANVKRMIKILSANYALIDDNDAEIFEELIIHFLRSETEYDANRHVRLPLEVYTKLGDVFSLPPRFTELVNRRCQEKKASLARLLGA
jgi:hypothetical protein